MSGAQALIARHGLTPHPEGGWYRETWRAAAAPGERAGGTAILFLLEQGQRSHWHGVDADELWLWHAGAPLELSIGVARMTLDATNPQALVPAGEWQAAEARLGWALVSCVVVPGFDFAGFTLAPPGWEPEARDRIAAPLRGSQ
ncbi:MAG TPA: cupin domain-containing protein [Sphingomonas sp.]|nr:cupin domain-containing protein [Sphingomonas sp.]